MFVTIWERDKGRWEAVVHGVHFDAPTPMRVYEAMLVADPALRSASVAIQPALPFPDDTRQ